MARRVKYGFEKRQKEIKKQQKRDAKLEKKLLKKDAAAAANGLEADTASPEETDVEDAG